MRTPHLSGIFFGHKFVLKIVATGDECLPQQRCDVLVFAEHNAHRQNWIRVHSELSTDFTVAKVIRFLLLLSFAVNGLTSNWGLCVRSRLLHFAQRMRLQSTRSVSSQYCVNIDWIEFIRKIQIAFRRFIQISVVGPSAASWLAFMYVQHVCPFVCLQLYYVRFVCTSEHNTGDTM